MRAFNIVTLQLKRCRPMDALAASTISLTKKSAKFIALAVMAALWQSSLMAAEASASQSSSSASHSTNLSTKLSTSRVTQLPTLVVYKNESCGCCNAWVDHVKAAGFPVEVRNVDNMQSIKEEVGVPAGNGSCHTARLGRRFFIEGHVPAEDIKRFLKEQPNARGLTVPGMPVGSPGMEVASGKVQPYDVYLVGKDGKTTVYAHHTK